MYFVIKKLHTATKYNLVATGSQSCIYLTLCLHMTNIMSSVAVVVAQLAERSLPIPEVRGSNPDTGKFLKNIYLLSTVLH